MGASRSNLNLDVRRGHRNQLGVTRGNQTGPKIGPKLDLFFCSHENGTVRYRIVPISGSLFRTAQFLDLLWNGPLDFFPYPCERNPLSVPLFGAGKERNGTISYATLSVILYLAENRKNNFLNYIDSKERSYTQNETRKQEENISNFILTELKISIKEDELNLRIVYCDSWCQRFQRFQTEMALEFEGLKARSHNQISRIRFLLVRSKNWIVWRQ